MVILQIFTTRHTYFQAVVAAVEQTRSLKTFVIFDYISMSTFYRVFCKIQILKIKGQIYKYQSLHSSLSFLGYSASM